MDGLVAPRQLVRHDTVSMIPCQLSGLEPAIGWKIVQT